MRRTNAERTATTTAALMDAALGAVVDLGYAGASTTEICKRAGVSRGAMLHHYPTRAALMSAAVDHLIARRVEEFQSSASALRQGDRPVGNAFAAIWEIYSGPTLEAWLELAVAGRTDAELRARLQRVDDRFFSLATATAASMLGVADPEEVAPFARMVLAFFDGLALNSTVNDPPHARDEAIALFESLVFRWVRSR